MTFAKAILKRKPFECRIMGIPMAFEFDEEKNYWAGSQGMASASKGTIVLDPTVTNNHILDNACHEVVEIINIRMDWDLEHKLIQQLGILWGSVLECDI